MLDIISYYQLLVKGGFIEIQVNISLEKILVSVGFAKSIVIYWHYKNDK